ncbi:MAG: Abi family protein, partial [Gammaproteobacteria bacterium]
MQLKTYNKPPLTFEQQLEKLAGRGLVIKDKSAALNALAQISYYRLSAYWHPFRQRDKNNNKVILDIFEANVGITDAIELYEFDRQLRLLVVDAIERIEVMIRTKITYHFGHKYGAFGHTQSTNFHDKFDHVTWLSTVNGEVLRSKEEFIK